MGSDDSEIPESVTMEDINEAGSISAEWKSVFFLVNEPKPDEPDAIDESSRAPIRAVGCSPVIVLAAGTAPAILPISSWDVIFLLFKLDEGLQKTLKNVGQTICGLYVGIVDVLRTL